MKIKKIMQENPKYFKGLSKDEKEERERAFDRRSKMSDDDPDAYGDFRSDAGEKTKSSTHTKSLKNISEPSNNFNLPVFFIWSVNL